MSSFNLDQSKILSSGNGLKNYYCAIQDEFMELIQLKAETITMLELSLNASALTETSILYTDRYMDGHTQMDRPIPLYPKNICFRGYKR